MDCQTVGRRGHETAGTSLPHDFQGAAHPAGARFRRPHLRASDRNNRVLGNLAGCISTAGWREPATCRSCRWTRASSIRPEPVFAKNPEYFDPENIVKLAIEGGCNAVASTFGVLGIVARKYAHKIPFLVKINHNELLTYPNKCRADHVRHGRARRPTWGPRPSGPRSISARTNRGRQIVEVAQAFAQAHELGMATVLWCYLRNNAFKKDKDYHVSADLTGQANHLGCTIQADIIKQKLPENNGGFKALNTGGASYGKLDERIYTELTTDHPIDLCRYQVANCYMGRCRADQLAAAPRGKNDLAEAVPTAVINKRAGGMGLITGRKAFQRPMKEGVELLNKIQDVYLDASVSVA